MIRSLILLFLLVSAAQVNAAKMCSYQTYSWNTVTKSAVKHTTVNKPFAELTDEEIDAYTGCSVCEQDQRSIAISPLKPFSICRVLAPRLRDTLEDLISQGEPLRLIVGYRVGKTRGDVDENGTRTRFSNHSFGIAIDVNPDSNGLYDNCLVFNGSCRLIRGGRWDPGQPESLTADSNIVHALEDLGLKWGGEIVGKQKDFMHFSPQGY